MTQRNVRIAIFLSTTLLFMAAAGLLIAKVAKLDREGSLGLVYQADVFDDEATSTILDQFPAARGFVMPGRVMTTVPDGPADRAGVRPGDTMLSVGGVRIADVKRIEEIDRATRKGQTVRVGWMSKGERKEADLTLESPLRNPSLYFSPAISVGIALAFFFIGTLVLRARREDRTALVFHVLTSVGAAFFLSWALFELQMQGERGLLPSGYSMGTGGVVVMAAFFFMAMMMTAALLHFSLVFPKPSRFIRRFPRVVRLVYLAAPLSVVLWLLSVFIGATRKAPWSFVAVGALMLLVLGLMLRLGRRLRRKGWAVFGEHPLTTYLAIWLALILALQVVRVWPPIVYFVTAALLLGALLIALSFGSPLVALAVLLLTYVRASEEDKQQFRWPLLGLIFAIGGILSVNVAGFIFGLYSGYSQDPSFMYMQVTIQSVGKLFYLLIPVSFAFGILKYRVIEIDLVVRKTIVYSIVSGIVLVVYLLAVGVIGTWIVRWSGVQDQVVVIIATLMVAVVFIPMRNRVQTVVDRGFFRHRANLQKSIRDLGSRLNETDDLGRMLRIVGEQVQEALQLECVVIVAGEAGEKPKYIASAPAGLVTDALMMLPLDRGLFSARTPLPPAALPLDPATLDALEKEGVRRVCSPHADRGAVATILAGRKLSEQQWDLDDDEFLATVAERMALSVESARLRSEEDEFRQAQSIQRSLLPREIPQLARLKIAGFWQPARAVGGDYYDAIALDDSRVAVCVGDVVGKGMPAAILMSSLQAGVRALADSATAPSEVVSRAQRVVIPSLDRGKFITFFYGVLDDETSELRYTNAGHNPPILLRKDGRTERLEAGGPALARLFAGSAYESGSVPLLSGDRMVIFTDGLTEAEDVEGRQFGEDEVVRVMRENHAATAGELQSALVTAALRHTGGTLQDDLTLVVVEVS